MKSMVQMVLRFLVQLMVASMVLVCVVPVAGQAASGDQGSATAIFLKLDPSARSTAMGSTRSGLMGNAFAASHNPAGLGYVEESDAAFTQVDIFQGVSYNHATLVQPYDDKSSWGLSYTGIDFGSQDRTEVGSSGSSDPQTGLGSFGADDLSVGLSYGRQLFQNHHLGGKLKYVETSIARFNDSTYSLDLGWAYQLFPNVKLGAAGRNLIGDLQLNKKSDPLPRMYDLGLAWSKNVGVHSLRLDLRGSLPEDADSFLSLGGEWGWKDTVFLRLGYNGEQEIDQGITFGGGLKWDTFRIDYSYENFGDLGRQAKLSLSYEFGGSGTTETVKKQPEPKRKTEPEPEPTPPLTLDYPGTVETDENEAVEFKITANGSQAEKLSSNLSMAPKNGTVESVTSAGRNQFIVRYRPDENFYGEDKLGIMIVDGDRTEDARPTISVKENPDEVSLEEQNKKAMKNLSTVAEELAMSGLPESVFVENTDGIITVGVSSDLLFDLGADDPLEGSREKLQDVADILNQYPERAILVDGHTDNVPIVSDISGKYSDNWELSEARAVSIAEALIREHDVDADRIGLNWHADEDPRVPNDSATNRFLNRRVEIKLLPPDVGLEEMEDYKRTTRVMEEASS